MKNHTDETDRIKELKCLNIVFNLSAGKSETLMMKRN